jgi:HEPN domain-containing protein
VTHSAVELIEESSKAEARFEKLEDKGKELDRHWIGARYPNFYPSGAPYKYYTAEAASKCISYAESILEEGKKSLKS